MIRPTTEMSFNYLRVLSKWIALGILAACAGTDSTRPEPKVDNVVASITLSADAPTTIQAGGTAKLTSTMRNAAGQTVTGRTPTWTSSDPTVATLSADGLLTSLGKLGSTSVSAAVGGIQSNPIVFTVTPGAPTTLSRIGSYPGTLPAGAALTDSIRVQITDAFGNGVPGITVTFATPVGGGSISPTTVSSDGTGRAAARFITGALPGSNTATATVAGLTSVSFAVNTVAPPSASKRALADRADQATGNQVHVMYVLPLDGADRGLDTTETLASSVGSFQNWLAGETGGRRLRVDTYEGGAIDITFLRISRTNAQLISYGLFIRDSIEKEMAIAGFNVATKIYAVYYDGGSSVACGGGAWPPALKGLVAALYLQGAVPGFAPCNSKPFAASPTAPPGYLEFSMLHELLHTLGFVASNAPNHTLAGHVSDDNRDLMYAGPLPWIPSILDVGKNDYFGPSVPAGVLNLDSSAFLTP